MGLNDLFGDFFEGFGARGKRDTRRGKDISLDIEISLEEVFHGVIKEVELKKFIECKECKGSGIKTGSRLVECVSCGGRGEVEHIQRSFFGEIRRIAKCPECDGEGKKPEQRCAACKGGGREIGPEKISLNIPPGVSDGEMLKIRGKGERGIRDGNAGDLYATIHVKKHPVFKREGDDIFITQSIPFTKAVLGGRVEIPTLGGNAILKISAGIESGRLIRLEKKGLPRLYGGGNGDQYIKIHVKTPKHITKKQKELIEKLKEEGI